MSKVKFSSIEINKFFTILKKLKKKKFLPLHEPSFDQNDYNNIKQAIKLSQVSTYGKFTKIFENKIKKYCKSNYSLSTINGTSALHTSLVLCGVDENSEVLLSTLGFISSLNSISYLKAKPIFCDCEKDSLGIDPNKLKIFLKQNCIVKNKKCFNKKSNKTINAAIITHVFGNPAKIEELCKILKNFKIKIVEDAAECFGSWHKKKHLGTFGDFGALSFNGNKILTTGGGGAILIKKYSDYKKGMDLIRNMKVKHPYEQKFSDTGYNYRLPSLNSSLGISQLAKINIFLKNKKYLKKFYEEQFKDLKILTFFNSLNSSKSNNWLNAVIIKEDYKYLRKKIFKKAIELKIGIRPVWSLLHKSRKYKKCQKTNLQNAISLEKRIITLPSSYNLITKK